MARALAMGADERDQLQRRNSFLSMQAIPQDLRVMPPSPTI
jgi:hypothetical protein